MPPIDDLVIYRPISKYPGYCVGNNGDIWSCFKGRGPAGAVITEKWHELKPHADKFGHLSVFLSNSTGKKRFKVHRIVLEAFVGPCPNGMECRHFPDRDPANNNLDNLQWGTRLENVHDKEFHETDNRGERHVNAKLTEDQVKSIRLDATSGMLHRVIAAKHGISRSRVWQIVMHEAWKHVIP